MTEVIGRVEAIVRPRPQLVEIQVVPLTIVIGRSENEHTRTGPGPDYVVDQARAFGIEIKLERRERVLDRSQGRIRAATRKIRSDHSTSGDPHPRPVRDDGLLERNLG